MPRKRLSEAQRKEDNVNSFDDPIGHEVREVEFSVVAHIKRHGGISLDQTIFASPGIDKDEANINYRIRVMERNQRKQEEDEKPEEPHEQWILPQGLQPRSSGR